MAQYDGVIRIVTQITTRDAEESLSSLEYTIKKSAKEIEKLRQKMDALKDQKIPTSEYRDLQKELSEAEKELSELVALQEEWDAAGTNSGGAWDALNEKIAATSDNIDGIKAQMQELSDSGRDFTLGQDTTEYAAMERQIQAEEEAIARAGEHYKRLQQSSSGEAEAEERLAQIREEAVVSNQRIVDAIEERRRLLQEISDMEEAGVGPGYEQYEAATQRVNELDQEIRQYNDDLEESAKNVQDLGDKVEESTQKNETGIKGSLGRLTSAVRKIGGLIAGVFIADKVVDFGKGCLEAAADAEAMDAQFAQVFEDIDAEFSETFGSMEDKAADSLSRIADQAGITEERMKGSYTKIASFAKTTGMDTAGAMELSNRAMIAVADSVAFYDRSLEETTESLQSFLKGNYENDAALGLSATEVTRNAAANKLYGKSFIDLSEAQKQLTLLQMVEDANALSGAMGQAAREADTWTNQTGNLNQAWTNLKANLGKFILPMAVQAVKSITNVINAINAMITRLSVAAGAFQAFNELLTGKKSTGGGAAGIDEGSMSGMGADYEDAATGAEDLASATDKAAKATKDAKKEAEGYLSPLDEINKIGKEDIEVPEVEEPKGEGVSGVVPGVDYGDLAEGETVLDKMKGTLDAVIERAKELAGIFKKGFFEGLGDYGPRLEDLKNDILSIGRTLKEIFTDPAVLSAATRFGDQLAYTLGQVAGSAASIGLTIANNLVGGLEKYLTQNKERIKSYLIEMFDIGTDILKTIGDLSVAVADIFSVFGGDTAQQITGNLIGIFAEVGMMVSENAAKLGRDILNMIAQPIIENKEKIKEAIQGTLEAIEPFTSGLLTAVQKVRDAISDIYDNHLKPLFDSIASGLSEILGKLLDGYNTYIVPVLQGLGDRFKELMEGPFGEALDKVKEFVGKLIDALKLLWEQILVPLFGWIADNVMPILADVIEYIGGTALTVLKAIIKAVGNIADVLSGVIDFIVGVFTGDWEKAWTGIKEIFSGVWELIKGILSSAWEAIKNNISGTLKIIKDLISANWNGIKTFASTIWNAIKTVISTVWNIIKNVTLSTWTSIKSTLSSLWNGLKNTASSVFEGISGIVSGAWNGIKSVTSTIWDGIVSAVKSPINLIIGFINGLLSGIQSMQNGIANAFNSLQIDLPDWLQGLTGYSSIGFNVDYWTAPQIPYLAQGTVVPPNREFMAVLGDNKREPEVVSPISTMKQAVLEAIAEAGGVGEKEITIKVPVYIGDKQVYEATVRYGKMRQMATGKNEFMLGNT